MLITLTFACSPCAIHNIGCFCLFVTHAAYAVQSAMPSAQNLVLLMQLRKSTQPLAPRMAALLLRIYAVAIIPVTAWITVFMSQPCMQALLV